MSRLRWLLFWRRQHDDLAREMHAHMAERVDELVEGGLAEADARLQARREFGNVTLQNERSHDVWIAGWLTSVWHDLRYAVRSLWRQPGFTLSASGSWRLESVWCMALVTVLNLVVLRQWNVPDPSSLVIVKARPLPGQQYGTLSAPEYRYLRDHSRTFASIATWLGGGSTVRIGATTTSVQTAFVTFNYLDALKAVPAQGRFFEPGDEDYVQPKPVAVISDRLWRNEFDRRDSVVGETISGRRPAVHGHRRRLPLMARWVGISSCPFRRSG